MNKSENLLEFTGERFTPECVGDIWLEHWHRYLFAETYVAGKRVLDVACGEGYGSHMLSSRADHVVGVDVSPDVVAHATRRYGESPGLEFVVGNCESLRFPDASFDVVVSFETIEHVERQEAVLAEFRRLLRPDGILIISSPNKKTYSDDRDYQNEYHVREFYRPEFEAFLGPHFQFVRLYGQKIAMHSLIWPEGQEADRVAVRIEGQAGVNSIPYEPLYFIAVCGNTRLAEEISILGEADEWLLRNYEDGMRKMIRLDREAHEREAVMARREQEIQALRSRLDELTAELETRRSSFGGILRRVVARLRGLRG